MTPAAALARLAAACADPAAEAAHGRAAGRRVVWTLGHDIPGAMVEAFGYRSIRLVPDPGADRAAIDALIGTETLGERGRALIATIMALPPEDALLISHADSEQPQIFANLRELVRSGAMAKPEVHFLDLLTIDRAPTRRYNRVRIEQTLEWLGTLGGRADADALSAAIGADNRRRELARDVMRLRAERRLSGWQAHAVAAASAILPCDEHHALLAAIVAGAADLPVHGGIPTLLGGSEIDQPDMIAAIEACGALVIGEDHGWGGYRFDRLLDESVDPADAFAHATLDPRCGPFAATPERAARLAARAVAMGAERVVHITRPGDEAAAWEVGAYRAALRPAGMALLATGLPIDAAALAGFIAEGVTETTPQADGVAADAPRPARPRPAQRSRKSLEVISRFGGYQREWFAGVRAAAAAGESFAAVNANAPQEMLRALGIPFVVNQWWASIVAAKQQSARYATLLAAHDLPTAVDAYSAQGVAAAYDDDPELAPWGGLPRPDILGLVLSSDATPRLFDAWSAATGAPLQRFHRSTESRWDIPVDWWDGLADRWDDYLEPERLDLFEAELREAIVELEALCGRRFDAARFAEIMDLVNEQEDHYRATRDMIAAAVPAPVSIADTMPATMVPQWHRGTAWARDAARDFHDEVAARIAAGEAVAPNERIRLMFVGRGIWSDMSFYQRWEESHGAVFVCSMYLSLAADGYIRRHDRGRDPMRALAARFVTMGDELRMPTWAGAWHVKEARLHRCDGAVALSDADPLVLRALREAGIAVLELGMDNFSRDPAAEAAINRKVVDFLEGPAAEASRRRLS